MLSQEALLGSWVASPLPPSCRQKQKLCKRGWGPQGLNFLDVKLHWLKGNAGLFSIISP